MDKLKQLKAACSAATPGEWSLRPSLAGYPDVIWAGSKNHLMDVVSQRADAEFIALAHNMMPALLNRIECLESAARIVIENWDGGDLAGAVRNLSDLIEGGD